MANRRPVEPLNLILGVGALLVGLYFGWVSYRHFTHECGAMVPPREVVTVLLLAGMLLVLGVIVRLQSGDERRSVSNTSLLSGALILVGLVVGYYMTPVLGLDPETGCRESVIRHASGTVSLSLDGQPAFESAGSLPARCESMADSDTTMSAAAFGVGTLSGQPLNLSVDPGSGSGPYVAVSIAGPQEYGPPKHYWSGPGLISDASDNFRSGTMSFSNLVLEISLGGGSDMPRTLAGRASWSCDPWSDDAALEDD